MTVLFMFPPLDCKSTEISNAYSYNSINSTQIGTENI